MRGAPAAGEALRRRRIGARIVGMLRTAFILVLGLASVSALGFTAFELTHERGCCHLPCEGMPLCAPANPEAPAASAAEPLVAEPTVALERASCDVSVPQDASDEQPAQATQPIRIKLTVPPRLPPCCSGNPIYAEGRAPQPLPQSKPMPPRSAEEKRMQQKLAAAKSAAGTPMDSALLAKQQRMSPAVALVPAQTSTKSFAAAALKPAPVK
jgi:hypothetical protein